jgi:Zn-dependent protease
VILFQLPHMNHRGTMPDFILKAGLGLPLLLILLALMGLRKTVTPRASVLVKAPIHKVFELLDLYDGKIQNWNRTKIISELVNPANQTFRMTYATTLSTGVTQKSQALFRVSERREPNYLELHREGLEGKSHNNELLRIVVETAEEPEGTRLKLAYYWGSRPFIAQILARADLWGGIYRLKGLAETGKPDETTHLLISLGVAVVTGFLTLVAFGLMTGWLIAGLLVAALFIHELGHLIAYRLIGQPWGRLVFLPFLGAIAVPRLAYESQGQAVFSALMGPGLSAPIAFGIVFAMTQDWIMSDWLIKLALVMTALNLFNLLPVEPLDGGVALRSVLANLMGKYARFGLMLIGAVIVGAGLYFQQVVLLVFGGISILANIRPRAIDQGLTPLSFLQVTISAFGYMAIITAYLAVLRFFLSLAE